MRNFVIQFSSFIHGGTVVKGDQYNNTIQSLYCVYWDKRMVITEVHIVNTCLKCEHAVHRHTLILLKYLPIGYPPPTSQFPSAWLKFSQFVSFVVLGISL